VTGAVAVLRDVTQAVAMQARMARLAHYDALTDLPNRVLLQDRAQQAIAQAQRDGKHVAVLYLDLDGFKQVNDAMGHDVGDQLLVQWAQRLQSSVRQTDTVCRQGGDEFVLLLPGLSNAQQASVVARKILQQCEAPFVLQDKVVSVGVSGGISLYPDHGRDLDELTRHADAAMYAAKHAGRNQVRLYEGPNQPPQLVVVQGNTALA
jgi:diguanylate cyclase (GGDEF)-like protein